MTRIVTHAQARALGYCNRGMRQFCARHGLDWQMFLAEGVPAEKLERTGDAMAAKLLEKCYGTVRR